MSVWSDRGNYPSVGSRTILPVGIVVSISRCASGAALNGNIFSILALSFPAAAASTVNAETEAETEAEAGTNGLNQDDDDSGSIIGEGIEGADEGGGSPSEDEPEK